jgi:HSP20 family protein
MADIEQLQDRMGNLIQSFFADPFPALTTAAAAPVWVPPADIEETDDAYLVEVDLPGVRPEDIKLELRDENALWISGEYQERERTGALRRQTRRMGQFEYVVMLPGEVDPDQIEADLHDGVLLVRLAKSQGGQPRRIEVKGSSNTSRVQGSAGGSHADGTQAGGTQAGTGQAQRSDSGQAGGSQRSGSGGQSHGSGSARSSQSA